MCTTNPQSLDLIIIGAGPAGLSTAMHLIRRDPSWGQRMVLLEKAVHPRPKLCGGGVTRFGLQALQELGFSLPLPLPQARVDNVDLIYRQRKIHVRGKPQFIVFHRPDLDNFLVQVARERGITIQEDETVRSLEVNSDHVRVFTSRGVYLTQIVVGADGAKGVVRQTLGGRATPKRIARLLKVQVPASRASPLFTGQSATFDFTPLRENLQGYFWDFPSWVDQQPAFNRGVYDARIAKGRVRADLPSLLKTSLESLGTDPDSVPLSGHPIHWFGPTNRLAGQRVLLVGDAAGVDPLFGEGIGPALGYGKIAAQAIEHAFHANDFTFKDYRRRVWHSPLGRYLWLRWFAAWAGYRLEKQAWFVHSVWTAGQILATIWRAGEKYP